MIANDLQKKERYAKPQRKNQQFLTSKLKKIYLNFIVKRQYRKTNIDLHKKLEVI